MVCRLLMMWIIVSSVLIGGCNYPPEFVEFYKLPRAEQTKELKRLPLDKQIDYHLLAMTREPPDSRFAEDIASQGDEIIPGVLRRLKDAKADYQKVDILQIFYELCMKQKCSETHPELIKEVEVEVSKMKNPSWGRVQNRHDPPS